MSSFLLSASVLKCFFGTSSYEIPYLSFSFVWIKCSTGSTWNHRKLTLHENIFYKFWVALTKFTGKYERYHGIYFENAKFHGKFTGKLVEDMKVWVNIRVINLFIIEIQRYKEKSGSRNLLFRREDAEFPLRSVDTFYGDVSSHKPRMERKSYLFIGCVFIALAMYFYSLSYCRPDIGVPLSSTFLCTLRHKTHSPSRHPTYVVLSDFWDVSTKFLYCTPGIGRMFSSGPDLEL